MQTVIYIHGFSGSGQGHKAYLFREHYKKIGQRFIAPSLSYVPDLAISTLEELIESYDGNVKLIGSSMGGFISIYLAQKYNLKAILINPAVTTYETLKISLGMAPNFYDESKYEWNENHLRMLRNYKVDALQEEIFMVLLQKGDELLDYTQAEKMFSNSKLIVEEGGSHSFEGIENHFSDIDAFITKNIPRC